MAAIANCENKILAWIESSTADLNTKIDALRQDVVKQKSRLSELKSSLNRYSEKLATTENEVTMLKAEVISLRQQLQQWNTLGKT